MWFFPANENGSEANTRTPQNTSLVVRRVVEHDLDVGKLPDLQELAPCPHNRPIMRIRHDLEDK
ncbi:hypothetical protein A3A03_02400 [Candidatus Nomurabacteria bacterium RIFCSPLOWO2_01_FULL_40_18]|uniref:Uncharacterized protein n=1 Tax=Candidatus Nomurabacteria bacterium RIFCSPLOWO2_01_FULL_40_18 TaxID=1801773 RepID=A0A1F6XK62_9BACT|nr:MAG: hypothetical protein A3A03_02400 [Candidatus Nomurabacteria bacterium RIFCSPLOWO2_01_FULL_40_18]